MVADLTKLPLLDAVVRETLRLHGTLPINTVRVTTSDMVIGGWRVPKGTPLFMPSYAIHVSPDNYLQPHNFSPDRWLHTLNDTDIVNKGRVRVVCPNTADDTEFMSKSINNACCKHPECYLWFDLVGTQMCNLVCLHSHHRGRCLSAQTRAAWDSQ